MRTVDNIETALKLNGWETTRTQLTFAPHIRASKGDVTLFVCFASTGGVTRQTCLSLPAKQGEVKRRIRYMSPLSHKADHLIKFIYGQVTEEEF